MALCVGRRQFLTALGGAAIFPHAACAQQAAISAIGFLGTGSAAPYERYVAGLTDGLKSTGHIIG
jgi:uncharacterized membrane protein YhiD involved in acid resistance